MNYLVHAGTPFAKLFLASSIVIVALIAYSAATGPSDVIGEAFVKNEFPPPSIFPVFLKPITLIMILSVVAWYSLVEMVKPTVRAMAPSRRSLVVLLLLVIAVVSCYEVLFNFMLWGTMLGNQSPSSFNPDTVVNTFPSEMYKTNLVAATKFYFVVFACSLYGMVALRNSGA
ncbi:MAG: hypothetical protein C4292_03250 [Nitrososphaera sp.]